MPEANTEPDDSRWFLLQNKIHEKKIGDAFALFRRHDIEPVLIKGWAIARLYPDGHLRKYTDIDLGVKSSDYARARALLHDEDAKMLNIDLHDEFRHLDNVGWELLFRDSQLVSLGNAQVRVLSEEDHLRLLCVHWLTDGGADKERLFDIRYAAENRSAGFDWVKCIERGGPTRRRWVLSVLGMAHRYAALDMSGLPFAEETERIPRWLVKSVEKEWASGIPLRGLYDSIHDWRFFLMQLRKRMPPNPVFATVDCEGEFDDGARLPYQLRSLLRRAIPGISRVVKVLAAGRKVHG